MSKGQVESTRLSEVASEPNAGPTARLRRLGNWLSDAVAGLLLLPVRFYRRYLSRLKPVSTCRFTPTCSAYAEEALRTHGVFRALSLTTWRLLRCQPFAKAGFDPVPPPRTPHAPAKRSERP